MHVYVDSIFCLFHTICHIFFEHTDGHNYLSHEKFAVENLLHVHTGICHKKLSHKKIGKENVHVFKSLKS